MELGERSRLAVYDSHNGEFLGSTFRKDQAHGELIGISALGPSATFSRDIPADLSVGPPLTSLLGMDMVEEESLWLKLPEEIVRLISKRLPLVSQCRLRCVCRHWEHVLSLIPYWAHASPPFIITSSSGAWNNKFFCHDEEKWFTLPFRSHPSMSSVGNWKNIVDASAGLVLHHCNVSANLKGRPGGRPFVRLCVCNPLTSSCRDISPKDPDGSGKFLLGRFKAKLLVDPVSKTFKVVLVPLLQFRNNNFTSDWTMIYDSTKSVWNASGIERRFVIQMTRFKDFFVWKNVLCAYNIHGEHIPHFVFALDMESGRWARVEAAFPHEPGFQPARNHFILSDNKRVLLFQFVSRERQPFFVWELLHDDGSGYKPDFSLSKWKEVDIGLHKAMDDLKGKWRRLRAVQFGMECIYLMFYRDEMGRNGVKPQIGLRYSLADGIWTAIPCPGVGGRFQKLHLWESGSEIESNCRIQLKVGI